uniref:Interferon-inducible protein Gig2 n=1 Tax=Epinephelus coioides TaxID=94232 RepID=F2VQY1_EPICO|nr:interferon-inducible protein Gig2 [Epinephelus coioides]
MGNQLAIMYHGTTRANARSILANGFRESEDGMLGRGVYLCRNLEDARRYPIGHPEHDKVVIKVEVNLGNVIVIDRQHHPRQETWHDSRYGPVYDTASVPAGCGMVQGGQEVCVWDASKMRVIESIPELPVQHCPLL